MQTFPTGTVVWLKSGGPAMTVNSIISDPQPVDRCLVSVEWFSGTMIVRDSFDWQSLQTTEPTNAGS